MRIILFCLLGFSHLAFSTTVGSDTRASGRFFSETLSGSGEFGASKKDEPHSIFNWDASLQSSKTKDTTTSDHVTDTSRDAKGSIGWTSESLVGIELTLDRGDVPDENLSESGGKLEFSFEVRWGQDVGELDTDAFFPWTKFYLSVGAMNFDQRFSASRKSRRGVVRPNTGSISLNQKAAEVGVMGSPWEDWKFDLSYTHYTYDRDVTVFESRMDSVAALRRGLSGFSETVGGLPVSASSLQITWYFADDWKAKASESLASLAVGGGIGTATEGTITYYINKHLSVTGGAEYDDSRLSRDTLGIAGLDYRF